MISVIVPVYKAEKYLHRCINSILAQTYTDFELILVDDGSPDNSGAICDEYAAKDNRVKVIHKENGGVTAARADGVKISKGDYITFVDADDTLPENALEILFSNISDEFDLVKGCYTMVGYEQLHSYRPMVLTCDEYRRETINNLFLNRAPWASLIRRELFDEKTFDIPQDIVWGEDMIMNIRLAFATDRKVKIISESVYNYISTLGSCTFTFRKSFEYFERLYHYILESIPDNKKCLYMNECINFRLTNIRFLFHDYIYKNIWKKNDSHKRLIQDIEQYGYKLKFTERIALHCNNPISCGIYFLFSKISAKLASSPNK